MSAGERIKGLWKKIDAAASKILTRKEFNAVLLFVGLGLAVLLFRGGKQLFYALFPPAVPENYEKEQHRQDSLFAALSARAIPDDSLKFYLPPEASQRDSSVIRTSTKAKDLSPSSISLNRSSREELMKLPGVGEVMSGRIVSYREHRGGFRSLEELMNVQGLGEKKFEKLKPYLRLE
jgi:comEA protein